MFFRFLAFYLFVATIFSSFANAAGGKVNLSPSGMYSTHQMGNNKKFEISGFAGSAEIQGHVSNFIIGLHLTAVNSDEEKEDTLNLVGGYLGYSFDSMDLHLGYLIGGVTEKVTTNASADFAFNEAKPAGPMIGFRKYFGKRDALLGVGLGLNLFMLSADKYEYKETVSGVESVTNFDKSVDSLGGYLSLIISFGDRSLFIK